MDFDIIIIGSGAGGGMSALALSKAGFKVALVERGPQFDPRKDYIQNYPDWETRRDPLKQAQRDEQTIDQSYSATYAYKDQAVSRGPLNYSRVHGVGGSTLHYQGEAHRFGEHAFEQKSRFGWGADWPIAYQDLETYYARAESLLGVAGQPGNPHKAERGPFPTPAHPLSARSQMLGKAAKLVGMDLLSNTLALPSKSTGGRTPCQHSGGCNFGCVFGAKSSIDQAIIPKALATGNLSLMSDTQVTGLELDERGEVKAVKVKTNSGFKQLSARRYVLAGGALETPRLMLTSNYGNQFDQVGRYFMETVVATRQLKLETDEQTYSGPPLDSRIWDYCHPTDDSVAGFVLGAAGYLYQQVGPINHAIKQAGIGVAHKQAMRDSFGKNLSLFGIAEQEPLASNRVFLSNEKDKAGVRKLKVHSEYSARDVQTIELMQEKLALWQSAIPAARLLYATNTIAESSATHVAGTCRMGNDPKQSVVDAFGKVHGKSNCYITDASVLTTQGAGDSPSLTIQALALRSADKIADELA